MTLRHAATLGLVAAWFGYVGVLLPMNTADALADLRERVARDPRARADFYLQYLRVTVVVVAGFAATLWLGGRGAAVAGIAWPPSARDRLLPAAAAAGAAYAILLGLTWLAGHGRDPAAFDYANQYARIEFLVPHRRRERDLWPVLSLAVAVTEELVYRGLFVLYLSALLGISPWWPVLPMAVVFGLAHVYQGWYGVVSTTALGIALSVLTIVTGSLWPAIAVHAVTDVRVMFLRPPAPAPPTAVAAWARRPRRPA